jgi:hypothetical protein
VGGRRSPEPEGQGTKLLKKIRRIKFDELHKYYYGLRDLDDPNNDFMAPADEERLIARYYLPH